MPELQLIMYEFQEWESLRSSEGGSKEYLSGSPASKEYLSSSPVSKEISVAYLLNLYQFSNAGFQLGVNILQSASHLKYK